MFKHIKLVDVYLTVINSTTPEKNINVSIFAGTII